MPDVGRADARRAQIGTPDGISHSFQVSAYSGEPFTSILAANLLANNRCRFARGDEPIKSGPQVSFVGMAFSESRARKRLTRTTGGPDLSFAGPFGESQGETPAADAGEEVALVVSFEIGGFDFDDGSLVNISNWNESFADECAQPGAGFWIDFIVIIQVRPIFAPAT